MLSISGLQQAVNTVHGQLCLFLPGKGKQSQMPYRKVNGSLLFLGKAASFLGVFSCTGVFLWRGSVICAFNRSNHLHSCSFHWFMVPSWALSKGRAFRSDLILFHTQELHHTWQVLGTRPGQEVSGLGQGSPRSVFLQPKDLCEALSITAFMCYHYQSILSVWDCFPLITSLNQY